MRTSVAVITETAESRAIQKVIAACAAYRRTHKQGMELGAACYEYQRDFGGERTQGRKGEGLRSVLTDQGVNESTSKWWIARYKEEMGIVDVIVPDSPEEIKHDAIAEAVCKTLIEKSVPCQNVAWAPWTAKTDAEVRDFGPEPVTDRYKVTLFLSQVQAENLSCPS